MRTIYIEVDSTRGERSAVVYSKDGEHWMECRPSTSAFPDLGPGWMPDVGPFKTVGRAMKAALMWCETGKVLYVTQ